MSESERQQRQRWQANKDVADVVNMMERTKKKGGGCFSGCAVIVLMGLGSVAGVAYGIVNIIQHIV